MRLAYRLRALAAQPQAAFVQAVLERLGMSQTEIGVALRKPNAYQQVHGWLTGVSRLGYEDTVALLDLCGWLNMDAGDREAAGFPRDRLAELEATVESQGKATTMALQSLARDVRKLERRLAVEAPQATKGQAQR